MSSEQRNKKEPEAKKMKDEDATELDWFLLENFCRQIFGPTYQLQQRGVENDKPANKKQTSKQSSTT